MRVMGACPRLRARGDGAWVGDSASALGGVIAQDVLRGVIIAFLILTAIVTVGDALAGGAISGFLGGLLGGGS